MEFQIACTRMASWPGAVTLLISLTQGLWASLKHAKGPYGACLLALGRG